MTRHRVTYAAWTARKARGGDAGTVRVGEKVMIMADRRGGDAGAVRFPQVGHIVSDEAHRVVRADDIACRIVGRSIVDLIGTRVADAVAAADRHRVDAAADAVLSGRRDRARVDCRFDASSGSGSAVRLVLTGRSSGAAGVDYTVVSVHDDAAQSVVLAAFSDPDAARLAAAVALATTVATTPSDMIEAASTVLSAAYGFDRGDLVLAGAAERTSQTSPDATCVPLPGGDTLVLRGASMSIPPPVAAVIAGRYAHLAEESRQRAERSFLRRVWANAPAPQVIVAGEHRIIVDANRAACALLGIGHADAVGRPVTDIAEGRVDGSPAAATGHVMSPASRPLVVLPLAGGEVDALTGVSGRPELLRRLDGILSSGVPYAALLVDLDDFKHVNDTLGHRAGDEVLTAVAGILRAATRPEDTVARMGGDEFAVLCRPGRSPRVDRAAQAVARRLVALLAEPIPTSAGPMPVSVSVGITDARFPATTPVEVLARADAAMYAAKRGGKNQHRTFGGVMRRQESRDRTRATAIATAAAAGRLHLALTPIRRTADAAPVGSFAAVRAVEPDGAPIPPASTIQAARRAGVTAEVDDWLVAASIRHLAGAAGQWVGVHVGLATATDAAFAHRLRRVLADVDADPDRVCLFLAENELSGIADAAVGRLADLHDRTGVRLGVDGFASALGSTVLLSRLPISRVAVAVGGRPETVTAAVRTAEALSVGWIVDGVTDEAAWQAARGLGSGLAAGAYPAMVRHSTPASIAR